MRGEETNAWLSFIFFIYCESQIFAEEYLYDLFLGINKNSLATNFLEYLYVHTIVVLPLIKVSANLQFFFHSYFLLTSVIVA